MYILASDAKSIVDSTFVERFCIVEKPDAVLIIASYSAERAVTIGKYANRKEAGGVLSDILRNLAAGSRCFEMPDSILFHGGQRSHDARTKRKGGS